tara:strand:+ start:6748 stop:7035 length:288 start_codon:yes stop_codon:yes gene_type:complete
MHNIAQAKEALVVSTLQALKLNDGTKVMLDGYIVTQLNSEEYTFQDNTGLMSIQIGYDKWIGTSWQPSQKVRIVGYVNKYSSRTKIDVELLILLD